MQEVEDLENSSDKNAWMSSLNVLKLLKVNDPEDLFKVHDVLLKRAMPSHFSHNLVHLTDVGHVD